MTGPRSSKQGRPATGQQVNGRISLCLDAVDRVRHRPVAIVMRQVHGQAGESTQGMRVEVQITGAQQPGLGTAITQLLWPRVRPSD